MPKPDEVIVTLSAPAGPTGGLHIDVSRWSHKISKKSGDAVEFSARGAEMRRIEVSWVGQCPFGLSNGTLIVQAGATGSTGPVVNLPSNPPQAVPYLIKIYFQDPDGNTRTATIDPDMIIDS